ncbi:hypothetical protein C9J03_11895 [Photobacterium gaetbulicola]|uniref:Uncharacterized protein n=1 Tax=Photobacterium gaetbulicola Gung47 TaxID=658445 RepID=A0A0C5WNH6_9GAMM|nr:hypothetical protein [Photobacterium gaetbulicola]AJR08658.1 hypothetical protein H744_2c1994 [Photobacterium gaetbulicola Gung47]PSU10286.1 hypothetical protein C9J03_11895 [Photobacterium gaetbulicola]
MTNLNLIPKQAAKAPKLGAAVSSMPLHDVTIPLDKPVTADFMAKHALDEWRHSMQMVKHHQRLGDKEGSAFFLNDAAEFRRIYVAFKRAIIEMGGL